jgi:hypothetical protein
VRRRKCPADKVASITTVGPKKIIDRVLKGIFPLMLSPSVPMNPAAKTYKKLSSKTRNHPR